MRKVRNSHDATTRNTRGQDNISLQLQPHPLYYASLLVYISLSFTYWKAPPTSTWS